MRFGAWTAPRGRLLAQNISCAGLSIKYVIEILLTLSEGSLSAVGMIWRIVALLIYARANPTSAVVVRTIVVGRFTADNARIIMVAVVVIAVIQLLWVESSIKRKLKIVKNSSSWSSKVSRG